MPLALGGPSTQPPASEPEPEALGPPPTEWKGLTHSASGQWSALEGFLALARAHGLYVAIHLVAKPPITRLRSGLTADQGTALGQEYFAWARVFIEALSPRHDNILLWGDVYALVPAA